MDKQSQTVAQPPEAKNEEKTDMIGYHRAFMGCLIGEPIQRDTEGMPMPQEVRRGLWQKNSAMDKAELWYLDWNVCPPRGLNGSLYSAHQMDTGIQQGDRGEVETGP